MSLHLRAYLSHVLAKARKRYKFCGFLVGGVGVGIIWPGKKPAPPARDPRAPELPFSETKEASDGGA